MGPGEPLEAACRTEVRQLLPGILTQRSLP